MISYMISYIYYRLPILTECPALSLQQPILSGHIALMQAMAATIQTEKWIQTSLTRHVTIHWPCRERAGAHPAAPLILCFISGNSHPTIPHSFNSLQGLFLEAPLLTHSWTGATAASSTRQTSGRGAMAGANPRWCPLQPKRLRGSGAIVSGRAGPGQQRLGNAHDTAHDIMFDIIFGIIPYVYMLSYVLLMISLLKSLTMLRRTNDMLVLG